MTARFDLGTRPHLGYTGSVIDRAAELRQDRAAIAALEADARARAFVIGGESIVMRAGTPYSDPTFMLAAFDAVSPRQEQVFLGRHGGAPLFGIAIDPDAVPPLKGRDDLFIS